MNFRRDILITIGAAIIFLVAALYAYAAAYGDGKIPGFGKIANALCPSEDERPREIKKTQVLPSGEDYPASLRAPIALNLNAWSPPQEDEEGWNFDLFTNPSVDWKPSESEYMPSAKKDLPLPPFGIKLLKAGHPTYPYLLRGTIPGRSGREEDRVFTIENVETKAYYERCKIKQQVDPSLPITLIAFKNGILSVKDDTPALNGRIIDLDEVKPLEFTDSTDVILASSSESDKIWTLHAVGEGFEYQNARFTVKEIDLENKKVTVEKTFKPNPKKAEKSFLETLTIAAAPVAVKVAPPAYVIPVIDPAEKVTPTPEPAKSSASTEKDTASTTTSKTKSTTAKKKKN